MADPPAPKKPRQTRGRYFQYLEPNSTKKIPESTIRTIHLRSAGGTTESSSEPCNEVMPRADCNSSVVGCSSSVLPSTNENTLHASSSHHIEASTSEPVNEDESLPSHASQFFEGQTAWNNENNEPEPCSIDDILTGLFQPNFLDTNSLDNEAIGTSDTSRTETGDFNERRRKYAEKHGLNVPLISGVKTTKFEALLMVLHLVMRHGNTLALTLDLIKFVNALLGENVLNPSLHVFSALFTSRMKPKFHFFCPNCESYLGAKPEKGEPELCKTCQACDHKDCNVSNIQGENVFLTLPIGEQVSDLLRRPGITLVENRPNSTDITDVMDGLLYRNLKSKAEGLNILTTTKNTDGVKIYDSARGSLWPFQFYVNELEADKRLRLENLIVAGLYYGKSAPNMCSYLRPILEDFSVLAEKGVRCRNPNTGEENVLYHVFPLLCSVDSSAKPKVQCLKQFNGNYACGFCLHPNSEIRDDNASGNSTTVRGYHTGREYPLRSHDSLKADMVKAHRVDRKGKLKKDAKLNVDDSVHGALGLSPLLLIEEWFDIVWGLPIDYMHNCGEGVQPRLLRIWTDGKYKNESFYLVPHLSEINKRIVGITPPKYMRKPRSLEESADWKAREWIAFLIFYSLPCLKGYLPEKYWKHHKKLVIALYILLQGSISVIELEYAEKLLKDYVDSYSKLYKDEQIVYNVHILLHLADVVRHCGPLWAYSNFLFESGNGQLLKYHQGTTREIQEISKKYLVMQTVSECFQVWPIEEKVSEFCIDVLSYSSLKNYQKCSDGVVLLGLPTITNVTAEEQLCLQPYQFDFPPGKIVYFNRAVKKRVLYYSRSYSKPTIHDDSCVKLSDSSYAVIEKLLNMPLEEQCYALIKPIRLSGRHEESLAPHIKTCASNIFAEMLIVPLSEIVQKCIKMTIDSRSYICELPNLYERD